MRYRLTPLLFCFFLLVYAQEPSTLFKDVSAEAGISAPHRALWDPETLQKGYLAVGQAWGDYDNDGFLDLYVTGNLEPNTLYHNEGDGTFSLSPFSEALGLPALPSGGAIWADYNNDGWQDLYVVNDGPNALFRNEGGQGFTDVTLEAGVGDAGKGSSATWGDYDGDGWLDLYVANWSCLPECQPENILKNQDALYHNRGDGRFQDVTGLLPSEKTLGAGFAASFFDADGDGDSDIFVVNDKMSNPIGNVLWRNDGIGCAGWCWTDASAEAGLDTKMHAMGLAVGDYNNDSQNDLYATNMMSPMALAQNLGVGTFADVSEDAGVMVIDSNREAVGWGAAFFDVDNDGWRDLYIATSAMPSRAPGLYGGSAPSMEDFHRTHPDLLYKNDAVGGFAQVADEELGVRTAASMGFAYADFNNDGLLDFVQGNWNEGYALYQNSGATGHNWLSVQLRGADSVNRDAAGSKVYVTDTSGVTQMQELILGQGLGAGHDTRLHFGLGTATIASLEVVWPNGLKQVFNDVRPNQLLELHYTNGEDNARFLTDWFRLAVELIQDTPGYTPPVASRALGYIGVTAYEALLPGMPDHKSLAGQLNGLPPLPEITNTQSYDGPVALDAALAYITRQLFADAPDSSYKKIAMLESLHGRLHDTTLSEEVRTTSQHYGQQVAEALYTWSLSDGGDNAHLNNFPESYVAPVGPGAWQPTAPDYQTALQPSWGENRPFFLSSAEACPVSPPLAYSEDPASAFYQEATEVYQTGLALNNWQRETAQYWSDDPGGTPTPPGHWMSILSEVLRSGGHSLENTAVAYAKLGIALVDSFVACWHAKYQYNLIRPITYIQLVMDSTWNSPTVTDAVATPPFPEYPSGHSVQSGAAAQVLTDLFGEVSFRDATHVGRGFAARHYSSFFEAADEAALSRLYGGIHYRAAIENGLVQGRCIGEAVRRLEFTRNPASKETE